MELSIRLKKIASMIDKCESVADIGTDHGYIPIYLVKNDICKKAIASDINVGPVEKAKFNVRKESLEKKIECRVGPGFKTLKPFEVNAAVIAGMGGNLIRDIIKEDMKVFKSLDYVVLQPVQNPEVLRKYIYESGFKIIDEELCFDEKKYYEIIKVKYETDYKKVDEIFYEIGENLLTKNHPLVKEYINYKISKCEKIKGFIKEETESAINRKIELENKICELRKML